MKSEATYRKEIHSLLKANVRLLAIMDTAITVLGVVVVFFLAKLVQAVSIAW